MSIVRRRFPARALALSVVLLGLAATAYDCPAAQAPAAKPAAVQAYKAPADTAVTTARFYEAIGRVGGSDVVDRLPTNDLLTAVVLIELRLDETDAPRVEVVRGNRNFPHLSARAQAMALKAAIAMNPASLSAAMRTHLRHIGIMARVLFVDERHFKVE